MNGEITRNNNCFESEERPHSSKQYNSVSTSMDRNSIMKGNVPSNLLVCRYLDSLVNKGTAYSLEERKNLNILGLIPPVVHSQPTQVDSFMESLRRKVRPIDKYEQLMQLHSTNMTLFFAVALKHVQEIMPLLYTPTVGEACQMYNLVCPVPKGLYITIDDVNNIPQILRNWPYRNVKVIVVTDGERILGLGDLGAYGMGIPVGKLCLYTALAGVRPEICLPITLDVGTNNQTLVSDKFYTGLKRSRLRGPEYEDFVEKFMKAAVECFGREVLIQFEDFGNANAFQLLKKYESQYLCFNDDIQGTAAVTLSGILAAIKMTNIPLKDNTFLFYGAGEASLGIAKLIVSSMKKVSVSEAEALSKIFLVDTKGLIVKDRSGGYEASPEKAKFAQPLPPETDLTKIVELVKPTVLIGAASQGGSFTTQILSTMSQYCDRPVIFALSNPTSKSECTAQEAYEATKGRAVFASGSPFPEVVYNGKTYHPGQCNNAYIFPAMGLACVAGKLITIPDDLFLTAAETLASLVTKNDFDVSRVYPPWNDIRQSSFQIALAILKEAQSKNLCADLPKGADLELLISQAMYIPDY
jgi:malate dehydrogenase (oxaloacetate-decarboxylating)(NADP+)